MVADDATLLDIPKVLFTLEHDDGGCRGMAVDRAMSAVTAPSDHHVEGSGLKVMAEDRVVVVDLVRTPID
jgi:hypothetical protein